MIIWGPGQSEGKLHRQQEEALAQQRNKAPAKDQQIDHIMVRKPWSLPLPPKHNILGESGLLAPLNLNLQESWVCTPWALGPWGPAWTLLSVNKVTGQGIGDKDSSPSLSLAFLTYQRLLVPNSYIVP